MSLFLLSLFAVHRVNSNGFSYFYLCDDISDPNVCYEQLPYIPPLCWKPCCSLHDDDCTPINTSLPATPPIKPSPFIDISRDSMYHNDDCIYETGNYLYDLYKLELNPYHNYSYFYQYISKDYDHEIFKNKWISFYINICNKSSVTNTKWNVPPNTYSLEQFINKSIVVCSEFEYDPFQRRQSNEYALCTQLGDVGYHTNDFTQNIGDQYQGLTINLGKTQCLYQTWNAPYTTLPKDIYIKLVIQCDPNTAKTEIISVDGPIFTLDQSLDNYPCSKNITITIRTNIGSCPRNKIYANQSFIHCPTHFNQTVEIINCTLYTQSNNHILTGNMTDIIDKYLNVNAVFGTNTKNISINNNNIDIDSNKTGVFNITFNITDLALNQLNDIKREYWQNISIYATATYPIGPNTTTRNISILYIANSGGAASILTNNYTTGWIVVSILIFFILYLSFRMKDEDARKFCCGYCIKCKCMEYGCNSCLIASYILCCDYTKNKQVTVDMVMGNKNEEKRVLKLKEMSVSSGDKKSAGTHTSLKRKSSENITFWGFLKKKWSVNGQNVDDELMNQSEVSAYSSTSEFLYRQQSDYAGYVGLDKQKTPKGGHNVNSLSCTEEGYIL